MEIINKNNKWDIKHPIIFTIIRLILGLILTARGVYFFVNVTPLYYLIKDTRLNELNVSMELAVTISCIHILGGTFIILGLLTRLVAWAQIPILIGAIIFINFNNSLSLTYLGLLCTLLILGLLILFAAEGGGKFSIDNYLKNNLV